MVLMVLVVLQEIGINQGEIFICGREILTGARGDDAERERVEIITAGTVWVFAWTTWTTWTSAVFSVVLW